MFSRTRPTSVIATATIAFIIIMRGAHDRPDEVTTTDAYIIGDVRLGLGVGVCFGCDQMVQGWGVLT